MNNGDVSIAHFDVCYTQYIMIVATIVMLALSGKALLCLSFNLSTAHGYFFPAPCCQVGA
eukprot:2499504-Amphidinium_carterae.1